MPAVLEMVEPHRARFIELLNHGAALKDIHAGPDDAVALPQARASKAFIDRELARVGSHTRSVCAFIDPSRFRQNGRILDAGCGTAALSVALAIRFPNADVQAFDANAHSIEAARVRVAAHQLPNPVALRVVPAGTPLPYEAAHFGLVTCASVIEFITDESQRHQFLRYLADATAPGGLLLLTTPNPLYARELHTRRLFQNWRRAADAPWASSRRWISSVLPDFDYLPESTKTPQLVQRRVGSVPGLSMISWIDQCRPWQFLCYRKRDA